MLFYPSQYEGEEESPNIFYTGATPRQQAIPAVDYLRHLGKKRFFLLGTETVYSRTTNAILKSYLDAHGILGDDLAEFYTPFNHKNWEDTVAWIKRFGARGDAATRRRGDRHNGERRRQHLFLSRARAPRHRRWQPCPR